MRYAHDCPRSWPDFLLVLSPADAVALRAFAAKRGVLVEMAPDITIEDLYTDWCQAGAVASPVVAH